MKEQVNDPLLHIKTVGEQKGFNNSLHYHPYEPTPYKALENLFGAYPLVSTDRFVDFGCGKGRLSFTANYLFNAMVVGIEMNEVFYEAAVQNRNNYMKKFNRSKEKLPFHCSLAQEYKIHPLDNKFYFFNPFSIQIFIKVIHNILKSYEEFERNMEVILYYGSQEYFYYLEDYTPFKLMDEIRLEKYESNPFEKFLIYRLSAN